MVNGLYPNGRIPEHLTNVALKVGRIFYLVNIKYIVFRGKMRNVVLAVGRRETEVDGNSAVKDPHSLDTKKARNIY